MIAAKILLLVAATFTALCIACAVRIGRRPHRAAEPYRSRHRLFGSPSPRPTFGRAVRSFGR